MYPTLHLTELGESALRQRAPITVSLNRAPRSNPRAASASATLAATETLLARGLTPEKIAAERGLPESTIYSHLATLISDGKVEVTAVIPAETEAKIVAAIEEVGSVAYLAPIKARLNDFTTYGEIRCVVEAWKRQHAATSTQTSPQEIRQIDIPFEALRRWRASVTPPGQPEWVVLGDGRLRRIAKARPRTVAELEGLHVLDANAFAEHGSAILQATGVQSTTVTEAILACVRALPGALPRSSVAKMLVGSEVEQLAEYRAHPLYSTLRGHNWIEVTEQVEEMLEHGLLWQDEHNHLLARNLPNGT